MTQSRLIIYTDGACIGNPGPGGWGFIVKEADQITSESSGGEKNTTNNRMELIAVIKSLEDVLAKTDQTQATVFSDSKYVVDAFRQNWIKGWQQRGWKTAAKKEVKNQDLWKSLLQLTSKVEVSWEWVKGHSSDPDNDYVDRLAREAAEQQR